MRTKLDIADDVLNAAKARALHEKKTVGQVISELARTALAAEDVAAVGEVNAIHGLRPFAPAGNPVTNRLIDRLREGDAY